MDVLKNYFLIAFVSTAFLSSITGCQTGYLLENGYQQAKLLSRRVSIEKLMNDPSLSLENRRKFVLIKELREFCFTDLGLQRSDNYTSFVPIDGDYVIYSVVAAPSNDLKPFLWTFPIVGSVPYKGFFNKSDAIREADELKNKGYDTDIRGVRAYSTLGWLRDPVLSSMLSMPDSDLVNLIIHESIHENIYIKSQADFNERLATYLGNVGTELFYQKREGETSPTVKKIQEESSDDLMFSKFISQEIKDLEIWYKGNPTSDPQTRLNRIAKINQNFQMTLAEKVKTDAYKNFSKRTLNNASLMGLKTYYYDFSDFEKAYKKSRSFKKLLDFAKNLESETDPEHKLRLFASSET